MTESLKKNRGNLGSKEAPSCYGEYNIRQKLVFAKLISTSPEEHFQPFLKNQNFRILFGQKFSAGLSKINFYVSREKFREKNFPDKSHNNIKFFAHFERKTFGLSAKKFRRDGQKCTLRVHRNILGFFKKKI